MAEREAVVTNEYGIHARPSALVWKEASKYRLKAYITKPNNPDIKFHCEDIMELMTMDAPLGTKLIVHVEGDDEEARNMCDNLAKLISADHETQIAEYNDMMGR